MDKFDQLKIELENSMIAIFSISETWLTAGINSNILQMKGYSMVRHDRTHVDIDTGLPKRGGGLAINHANTLSCDSYKWADFNISTLHIRAQVVEFIRDKVRNIVLINVYRPPNGNVQVLIDCLSNIVSNIPILDRKDIVIMGDFNIDLLDKSLDAKNKKLIRFQELNSMLQFIKSPTRISPTSASIIDLIFCSMTHVSYSGIMNLFLSDHQPVYLIKKMNTSPCQNKTKKIFTGRTQV